MSISTQTHVESVDPATGRSMRRYPLTPPAEVERALETASRAFAAWRDRSFEERGGLLRAAADYLRQHKARVAGLVTAEMGKPIVEAEAEVEKCALGCEYYAEHAKSILTDEPRQSSAAESYVAFEPLGTVLAVMPWNFPLWQVFRFAAPALMAGNTAILKHASNVPGTALAIAGVFSAVNFPEGVFRTLLITGQTAEQLIEDRRIAAVTLTGSDSAGSRVAAAAGKALKKSVLELGGSDPFVILEDADLELASTTAVRARYQNAGQSCIAAKRFVVVESVADEFLRRFTDGVSALKVGDPTDRATNVGPLARADLRDALDRQVRESVQRGAKVVLGGQALPGAGFFYAPTVLTGVDRGMPAYREETFGPVAAVIRVPDEATALQVANDTRYGLGASLWTRDVERAKRLARRIEAGLVFVNGMVASEPGLPFGGVKRSGYGRELSDFGIREFVNVQTVWVGPAKKSPAAKASSE